jgi:hypothetical protein
MQPAIQQHHDQARAREALRGIARAIIETAAECAPEGIASGVAYAVLIETGATRAQYDAILGGLQEAGMVTIADGNMIRATRAGFKFAGVAEPVEQVAA